jgi:hypothetical protein
MLRVSLFAIVALMCACSFSGQAAAGRGAAGQATDTSNESGDLLDEPLRAEIASEFGIPIVMPCWLPSDLLPEAHIAGRTYQILGVAYFRRETSEYPLALSVHVQPAQQPLSQRGGEAIQINGTPAMLEDKGEFAMVEWLQDGALYTVDGNYSRELILQVADSIIHGCMTP